MIPRGYMALVIQTETLPKGIIVVRNTQEAAVGKIYTSYIC